MTRFNGKAWLLTYSTGYVQHTAILKKMKERNREVTEAKIVNELGQTNHKHTHAFIVFKKSIDLTSPRWADVGEHHPNIVRIKWNLKNRMNVYNYLLKELKKEEQSEHTEFGCERYKEKQTARAAKVLDCDNVLDAMIEGGLQHAIQAKVMWEEQASMITAEPDKAPDEWNELQDYVMQYTETKPDDRHILWITDEKGGAGKTRVAGYLNDRGAMYIAGGNSKDIIYAVTEELKRGWCGKTIIFDFPRQFEDYHTIYMALEQLKNRRIFNSKYNSRAMKLKHNVHIIVMANWWPKVEKMSLDRWILIETTNRGRDIELRDANNIKEDITQDRYL